jgi:hypothetical protein
LPPDIFSPPFISVSHAVAHVLLVGPQRQHLEHEHTCGAIMAYNGVSVKRTVDGRRWARAILLGKGTGAELM